MGFSPAVGNGGAMSHRSLLLTSFAAVFCAVAFVPARALAEGPLSVALQAVIPSGNGGGSLGGNTQLGVGVGYDFGPPIIIPVRATAQFDYNGGSGGDGTLSTYGFTAGARLTTPIYAGIGIGPYVSSYTPNPFGPEPFPPLPPGSFFRPNPTTTAVGLGTKFTVGDRIFSLPGGVSLSLEASYQLLPSINGVDPSAARLGVRLHI